MSFGKELALPFIWASHFVCRIQSVSTYFAISPVGQQELPGPLNVTFEQTNFDPEPSEQTVMLIHWNPGNWTVNYTILNVLSEDICLDSGAKVLICYQQNPDSIDHC